MRKHCHVVYISDFLAIDSHHMIPFSSDGLVDFTSNTIVNQRELSTPAVKLHGK